MALIIDVYVNQDKIDRLGIVNTGHVENGKHLYRIKYPEKYNHLEIYHDRAEPWTVLVEKALHLINTSGI